MARNSKTQKNNVVKSNKKRCSKCLEEKDINSQYYISYSKLHADGRVPTCKECLEDMFDFDNLEDSLQEVLRMVDKPYIYYLVEASLNESPDSFFRKYMKNVAMHQFRGMTWKDSIFASYSDSDSDADSNSSGKIANPKDFVPTEEILEKWGYGYTSEEYFYFEKKYHLLKNNYPERTAMHTEALLTYIRYRVKEELATAAGLPKEAKDWGALAKDAATAAKINPSQLSQSDLSGGLDSFSTLTRSVEQAVDVIEILPKFKERPKDRVDVTIWAYINYIRDLKGLPPASYKEIYEFYEARKKEYESLMLDGEEDGEL